MRPTAEPTSKKRDPDQTREALLGAARTEFQTAGYDRASTRKIASDAGCNAALINRYFGSKLGLFEAVMEACIDLSELRGLSGDELVQALVGIALAKTNPRDGFDPLVVAIRSSGSAEALNVIRQRLGNPMVEELAALIGGQDAHHRAGLALGIISGMFVGRASVGADVFSDSEDQVMKDLLVRALSAVVLSPQST